MKQIKIYGLTIDPSGSPDLDDGLCYHQTSEAEVIHVAITNVAKSVKPHSPLFRRAKDRIETDYRRKAHIPMTSYEVENKQSLFAGKYRSAMILTIVIRNGQIDNYQLRAGKFLSRRQLTYSDANELLVSRHLTKDDRKIAHILRGLQSFKQRYLNGAIKEITQSDNLYGHRAKGSEHGSSAYQLVSFYMKLTSMLVTKLAAQNGIPLIHRNHGALHTVKTTNGEFSSNVIYLPKKHSTGRVTALKANYSAAPLGHFNMRLPAYARNTSPLRRFEDLVNQQQLYAFVLGLPLPWSYKEINAMALHIDLKRNVQENKITEQLNRAMERTSNLDQLDNKLFNHMIVLAIKNQLKSEVVLQVKQQIIQRMRKRKLAELDYLILLYRAPYQLWSDIQQQLLKMLQKDGEWRSRLYNVLDRLEEYQQLTINHHRSDLGHEAHAIITIGNRQRQLPVYAGRTKQIATRHVVKAAIFDLYNLKHTSATG